MRRGATNVNEALLIACENRASYWTVGLLVHGATNINEALSIACDRCSYNNINVLVRYGANVNIIKNTFYHIMFRHLNAHKCNHNTRHNIAMLYTLKRCTSFKKLPDDVLFVGLQKILVWTKDVEPR
jgi:hypothetical protein